MDTRRERIDIERLERSIRLLAANRIDNYGKDRVDDVLRNNATPPTSIGYGAATTRSKTSHSMRTSPRKRYSFAPQRPQSPRENIHDRSKQQKFLNTQTSSPKRVRGYMVHQYPKHIKHGVHDITRSPPSRSANGLFKSPGTVVVPTLQSLAHFLPSEGDESCCFLRDAADEVSRLFLAYRSLHV